MELQFSVIIPVYNIDKYLRRCVDSFLNQTFSNYEIILIDDGSTDRSGKICDEYSAKNKSVRVIHQKNAGVSAARNAGLDVAKGKYIIFADSDDFVEPDLLSKLIKSDADLVIVGFNDYYHQEVTKTMLQNDEKWYLSSSTGIEKYLKSAGAVFVWGKRYSKSIINDNKLRFREDFKISEDILFNNEYILMAKTAEIIRWVGYYHCQYDSATLSARYQLLFNERNRWRKISYYQYSNYPVIQKKYVSQTLYFAEKEFVKISKSDCSFVMKSKMILQIIGDPFFRKSMSLLPELLPTDVRFFCHMRIAPLIVLKYSKS